MRRIAAVVWVLAGVVLVGGCSKQADTIVGTWRMNGASVWTFDADGTYESCDPDGTVAHSGSWELSEKENGELVLAEQCVQCTQQARVQNPDAPERIAYLIVRFTDDGWTGYEPANPQFDADTSRSYVYAREEPGAVSKALDGPISGSESPAGTTPPDVDEELPEGHPEVNP